MVVTPLGWPQELVAVFNALNSAVVRYSRTLTGEEGCTCGVIVMFLSR